MHPAWLAVTLTENTEESEVTGRFQKALHRGCCLTWTLVAHLRRIYGCLTLCNVILTLCFHPSDKWPLLRKVSHKFCVNPEKFQKHFLLWMSTESCFVSDRAKVTKGLPDVVAIREGKVCQSYTWNKNRPVDAIVYVIAYIMCNHIVVVWVTMQWIKIRSWLSLIISFYSPISLCVWHASSKATLHQRASGFVTTGSSSTRTTSPSPKIPSAAP